MTDQPTVQEFAEEVEQYLSANYSRKKKEAKQQFVWGEGSDEVKVFQEPDPDEDADAMPAIRAWRKGLWDAGLGWITGPTELGGRGLGTAYQRTFERISRLYDVPGDSSLTIGLGMVAPTILKHGTDEQKRKYLTGLYNGDLVACQLFSEPGAGSDLASVGTKAVRDGDNWILNGQKVWTSGAHLADFGEIICKTNDGARHQNLTGFLLDMKAPGVDVRPLRQMTGGAAFNEVFLNDVVVPDSDRLAEEGEGWKVAITTLMNERNAMGNSSFGGAGILSTERIAELIRHSGLAEDPVVRQEFAAIQVRLRVARYTNQVFAAKAKAGDSPGPVASINKIALSTNIAELGRFVADVLGPRIVANTGEWGTYAWTSMLLGAPGYRLGGGTDEILKNMVAQRVLGLPRSS